MKHINCLCMATLFMVGTQCTSQLRAEDSKTTDSHATTCLSRDTSNTAPENSVDGTVSVQIQVGGDISTAEIAAALSAASQAIANEMAQEAPVIEQDIAQEAPIVAQSIAQNIAQEAPVVAQAITQDAAQEAPIVEVDVEADFDTMVEELVQSGAVEDDISTLESQPQWKLLLAQAGSYLLSLGVSGKEAIMNLFTNVQNTLANYLNTQKKSSSR